MQNEELLNGFSALLDEKLKPIHENIARMQEDIGTLKQDVSALKSQVSRLEKRMDKLEVRMERLENRMERLEIRTDSLESQVRRIDLHLENETDRHIRILAENHIDLVNKLNSNLDAVSKNRLYEIQVDYLVNEYKKRTQYAA